MPPWFVDLMKRCESLSLDSRADQERLWILLRDVLEERIASVVIKELLDVVR